MTETAICRDCGNFVPVDRLVKGPDLDGTGVCTECWIS
jgi:hypothetical protein